MWSSTFFFNGHYDSWCYLPVMGFISFNEEAEQYLCAAVLRPGNAPAAVGAVGLLRRLIRMLRGHFPGVTIRVRLDGGFASPAVLEFLDAQSKLEYVVAMAKNAVLKRIWQMASSTPGGDQSGSRPGAGKRSQRQSPLRDYQHEAESAMDLRTGVLPTWRR
jgi:hypothetical protein